MAKALEAFSGTFPAAGDLSSDIYKLMVLDSSGNVALATVSGQRCIGVLQRDDADAATRAAAVQWGGIAKVKIGGTVDEGDQLITNASGLAVTSTDGGWVIGTALDAGSANDVIAVLMSTSVGNLPVSKGTIPLHLPLARELSSDDTINTAGDAGVLSKNTTPILEATNGATDRKLQLKWAASNSDAICWDVPLPADLDGTQAMTIHCMAKSAGATDTPTLTWTAFFNVGDTNAGGATAAVSATLAELTRSLAASDVPEPPGGLTVTLVPGAHTTDAIVVTSAWIEYARR